MIRPWRALRNAYTQRLSWKLALSHLTVTADLPGDLRRRGYRHHRCLQRQLV